MKGNDIMNNELMENARSGASEKQVVKRDGKICPYELSRIRSAVYKAYVEVYHNEEQFKEKIGEIITEVNRRILEKEEQKINIEEIQDIVIEEVNKVDKVVGKAFSDYREERSRIREKNSKRQRFYEEVLNCSNIDNDNANVNQCSFSGRKYRIADFEQKEYALKNLISKEGREAFEEGLIYYHDLSSYAIGEHNCLLADIDRGLKEGFRTRNGDVRPANSYSTACQLVAVIFQCQSQV